MIGNETEIKPCPFCAHPHVYVEPPTSEFCVAIVTCAQCGAMGPVRAGQTVGEAVYRWNTRPATVPVGAQHAAPVHHAAAEDVTFFVDL